MASLTKKHIFMMMTIVELATFLKNGLYHINIDLGLNCFRYKHD